MTTEPPALGCLSCEGGAVAQEPEGPPQALPLPRALQLLETRQPLPRQLRPLSPQARQSIHQHVPHLRNYHHHPHSWLPGSLESSGFLKPAAYVLLLFFSGALGEVCLLPGGLLLLTRGSLHLILQAGQFPVCLDPVGIAIWHPLENLIHGRVDVQRNNSCQQMEGAGLVEQLLAQPSMAHDSQIVAATRIKPHPISGILVFPSKSAPLP
jgi:hypothetical protein